MEKKKYEKYHLGSLSECLEERAVLLAQYMIEHKATVRQTASVFGVSKSTVHKDVTDRLEHINPSLAARARCVRCLISISPSVIFVADWPLRRNIF